MWVTQVCDGRGGEAAHRKPHEPARQQATAGREAGTLPRPQPRHQTRALLPAVLRNNADLQSRVRGVAPDAGLQASAHAHSGAVTRRLLACHSGLGASVKALSLVTSKLKQVNGLI